MNVNFLKFQLNCNVMQRNLIAKYTYHGWCFVFSIKSLSKRKRTPTNTRCNITSAAFNPNDDLRAVPFFDFFSLIFLLTKQKSDKQVKRTGIGKTRKNAIASIENSATGVLESVTYSRQHRRLNQTVSDH